MLGEGLSFVDYAIRKGFDRIVITDQNSGEYAGSIKEAANDTFLEFLPGVNISYFGGKNNIHVVTLFDNYASILCRDNGIGDR
jgi:hypothetical protein